MRFLTLDGESLLLLLTLGSWCDPLLGLPQLYLIS